MTYITVPSEKNHSAGFIADIQIMRAFAILGVLAYHFSFLATVISNLHLKISNPLYSGVDLFFVISGFVVTRSLIRNDFNPFIFALRRLLRLYPALLVFLFFAFFINEFYRNIAGIEWSKNFFSIPARDFLPSALAVLGGYFINKPGIGIYSFGAIWSLSVEFQFYAVLFVLMSVLWVMRLKEEYIQKIFLGCAVLIVGYCVYARLALLLRPPPFFENYLINYRFDFMAMGVILAFVPQVKLKALANCTPNWAPLIPLIIGWIALMFFRVPESARPEGDTLMSIGMLISGLAFTITIALSAEGNKNESLPPKLRSALLYIGDRSYAIYLLHFPVMAGAWYLILRIFPKWISNPWFYGVIQVIFSSVLVIVLAECTARFVEKPAVQWSSVLVKKLELRKLGT